MNVLEFKLSGPLAQPAEVYIDGEKMRFAPREIALLVVLARAEGEVVYRGVLLTELEHTRDSLYRTVHCTRRRLEKHAQKLEQVGVCTTRHRKLFGTSGYRLVGFEIRWSRLDQKAC